MRLAQVVSGLCQLNKVLGLSLVNVKNPVERLSYHSQMRDAGQIWISRGEIPVNRVGNKKKILITKISHVGLKAHRLIPLK